jgi:hypothetical protein
LGAFPAEGHFIEIIGKFGAKKGLQGIESMNFLLNLDQSLFFGPIALTNQRNSVIHFLNTFLIKFQLIVFILDPQLIVV